MNKLPIFFCLLTFLFQATLVADTIVIEVSATATGSLAANNFSNESVVITAVGDTENVIMDGAVFRLLDDLAVTVEVGQLDAVFTDAIQAVVNTNSELGGFGNTSNEFGLLLIFNDAFATYDLLQDLDPVSGFGVIVIGVPHQTSAGPLRFLDVMGPATFSAQVLPACEFQLGDTNQDGETNLLDVSSFVNAIATGKYICQADINGDGNVDLLDVDPFVDLLSG